MVIIKPSSGEGILNNLFPLTLPHSAFGQLWDDRTFNVGRRVFTMLPGVYFRNGSISCSL